MENLASYLKTTGKTQGAFADQIGVDQSVISRFVRGEARPGLDLAFQIESATGGAVPASSWAKTPEQGAQQ